MVKKICFFTNKISLSGGAERVICTLASSMADRGIDTTIITQGSTECGYPLHKDVRIVATKTRCRIPGIRGILRCFRLRSEIKRLAPDAAISFMVDNNLILSLFTLGLPCVKIGSDRIFPKMVKGLRARLCPLIYPLADGFVFQTKEARECFGGKVFDRSTVIANPLVGNIPERSPDVTRDVVTVGRLSSQKNHPLLIRSFARFFESHPDYRLKIYGKGEKRDELQGLINELGIGEAASLMGTSERVLDEIRGAGMFVLSSDYEGMPNALAEAMAIGIPCISTDCLGGGAAAIIKDGVNGRLVPIGDENALAEAMSELADDHDTADRMSQMAVRLREELSVDNITDLWISYIEKVIESKRNKSKSRKER